MKERKKNKKREGEGAEEKKNIKGGVREQQANKGRRKKNKEQKGEGAEEKQAKKGRRSGRKTS